MEALMTQICRFTFKKEVTREFIEEQVAFAILSAECTFGQAKVRLNAAYLASDNKVVIDVSNKIGEHIAEVFTGLMIKFIGNQGFTFERIKGGSHEGR